MEISLEDIVYHLTSNKSKPNKIMKTRILSFFKQNKIARVLDYGCGKFLRDSILFSERGMIVDAVDIEKQIERIGKEKSRLINSISDKINHNNYDAALLNFVLQVIPIKKQRERILEKVCNATKNEGYIVLSLRNKKDLLRFSEDKKIRFKDGLLMTKGKYYTFVKGYDKEEIMSILKRFNLKQIDMYQAGYSYITLSQKNKKK
jgi:hypothetical protein